MESKGKRQLGKGSRSSSISSERSGRSIGRNVLVNDPLSAALEGSDPLSKIVSDEIDPLSKMAAQIQVSESSNVCTHE